MNGSRQLASFKIGPLHFHHFTSRETLIFFFRAHRNVQLQSLSTWVSHVWYCAWERETQASFSSSLESQIISNDCFSSNISFCREVNVWLGFQGGMTEWCAEDLGLACPSSRVCKDQSGDGSILVIQFHLGSTCTSYLGVHTRVPGFWPIPIFIWWELYSNILKLLGWSAFFKVASACDRWAAVCLSMVLSLGLGRLTAQYFVASCNPLGTDFHSIFPKSISDAWVLV